MKTTASRASPALLAANPCKPGCVCGGWVGGTGKDTNQLNPHHATIEPLVEAPWGSDLGFAHDTATAGPGSKEVPKMLCEGCVLHGVWGGGGGPRTLLWAHVFNPRGAPERGDVKSCSKWLLKTFTVAAACNQVQFLETSRGHDLESHWAPHPLQGIGVASVWGCLCRETGASGKLN